MAIYTKLFIFSNSLFQWLTPHAHNSVTFIEPLRLGPNFHSPTNPYQYNFAEYSPILAIAPLLLIFSVSNAVYIPYIYRSNDILTFINLVKILIICIIVVNSERCTRKCF